jgi:acyl carrier protein
VLGHVQMVVANALGYVDADTLDVNTDLFNEGFDSLMAIQVRNALQRDTGLELPLSLFFESSSIKELATKVLEKIQDNELLPGIQPENGDDTLVASEQARLLLDNMDQLSDEEVASLLSELDGQRGTE